MKKLEIGCGNRPIEGYDNLDIKDIPDIRYPGVDARKLPIDGETYDEVFNRWVLEHFGRGEIVDVLKEWRRVLKKNGVLKLVANNQDAINRCLVTDQITWNEWNRLTFGSDTHSLEGCHKIGLTKKMLQDYLEKAGFILIDIKATWKCREPDGSLKCPGLIVETVK